MNHVNCGLIKSKKVKTRDLPDFDRARAGSLLTLTPYYRTHQLNMSSVISYKPVQNATHDLQKKVMQY